MRGLAARARRRLGGAQGESQGQAQSGVVGSDEAQLIEAVRPYTLTSPERVLATADAVEYVVRRRIPGALVECGVWRGGSVLAMILTLQRLDTVDRDVYLYDTFDGMTLPTEADTSRFDGSALDAWRAAQRRGDQPWHDYFRPETFSLDQVQELLRSTGYPEDRIHFVVGPVEQSLPDAAPEAVSVLRLDTDWYESTRHELRHLYPRLSSGGVLLIDDYGHWDGCRRAVDEYFSADAPPILLHRIDYTCRAGVKG